MSGYLPDLDNDNRLVNRVGAAKDGWSFTSLFLEFVTSTLSSAYCKDIDNNDMPYTLKFYNSSGTEITDQPTLDTDCVETRFTISLPYDFEIRKGHIFQNAKATGSCRVFVHAGAVQLGTAYTGTFLAGVNLAHVEQYTADGLSAKMLYLATTGVPVPTNEMQFILRHDAGLKHEMDFAMEYFNA